MRQKRQRRCFETLEPRCMLNGVNGAPALDPSGIARFAMIGQDATDNVGNTVQALIDSAWPLAMITDADAGALQGIAVTGVNESLGNWQFSTDAGANWSDVGDVSDTQSLLLRPEDLLRFVPDGTHADTAAVTFRAWDQTGSTAGQQGTKVDVGTPGGTSPFSSDTETASITVTVGPPVYIPTDITGAAGSVVTVPVMIADAEGLQGADITINYDTNLLDATEASVGAVTAADSVWPAGTTWAANVDDTTGTITVSIANFPALGAGGGSLLTIDFTVKDTATVSTQTTIGLETVSLNEGHITYAPTPQSGNDATDGEVTVNAAAGTARISGFVYADTNKNNTPDATEGVPGVKIMLSNGATGDTQETWTDDNGWYEFRDLAAGTYQVSERQPAALLNGGSDTISGVTVDAGQSVGSQNFRELGLRPEYVFNRLYMTSTHPVGCTHWCGVMQSIVAQAEKDAGNTVDPAPPVVTQQVVQTGSTVTVRGTNGNDTFQFVPGATEDTVILNGESHTFAAASVSTVTFDGGLGKDTAEITGSTAKQQIDLSPMSGTFQTADYTVSIYATEKIAATGGSGGDEANLQDSAADDSLVARGNSAGLAAYFYSMELSNMQRVHAISSLGGNDTLTQIGVLDYVLETEGDWHST